MCYNNSAKVKGSNSRNRGRWCERDLRMEKGGMRRGEKGVASEGYQQLWQLCGHGELSHNREVLGLECRTDQPDSGLHLGLRHNIQQLANPKLLCQNATILHSPASEKHLIPSISTQAPSGLWLSLAGTRTDTTLVSLRHKSYYSITILKWQTDSQAQSHCTISITNGY